MRLEIENFAKIGHADIVVDGITVLAGKNNTGKSTVGKALYAVFNALYGIDEKIENRRREEIRIICSTAGRNLWNGADSGMPASPERTQLRRSYMKMWGEIAAELGKYDAGVFTRQLYREIFEQVCERFQTKYLPDIREDFIEDTYEKILSRKKYGNHKIAKELIGRYFQVIFSGQIQCLKRPGADAAIRLTVREKEISMHFFENACVDWKADLGLLHEAFFLDDPFVIDGMGGYYSSDEDFMLGIRDQLAARIEESDRNIMNGLFDAVSAREKLAEVYAVLNQVIKGEILRQNGDWVFATEQYEKPVNLENLSAGLKSFAVIKFLLERGILKERDVLVLDEPEIHLHPEWQMTYAEIIVLLQKSFDLSIIVTTHSAHFLEAVDYFSKKHGVERKCNYYLSSVEAGLASFENVTHEQEKIYAQLVTPGMLLDKLKYEMECGDEE